MERPPGVVTFVLAETRLKAFVDVMTRPLVLRQLEPFFADAAKRSRGVLAIGVLRADVTSVQTALVDIFA